MYTKRMILYSCNSREEKLIKKVHRWSFNGPRISLSQFLFLLFSKGSIRKRKFSQADKENLLFLQ